MTFETATAADAEAAFAGAAEARAGELLGDLEGAEIRKKKGPYGYYAECKGFRIPLKEGDEELERIKERFVAKISFASGTDLSGAPAPTAYERKVGDFTIKRGPYGLYFFKHTLKRATFVKFPPTIDPDKTTVADLSAYYSDGINKKRRGGWGGKKGATEDKK